MQDIYNNKILKYLNNELEASEKESFEKDLLNDDMMSEAVEGLQLIENKKSIDVKINELNNQLKSYTSSKKKNRIKRNFITTQWLVIIIASVFVVCLICYLSIVK